MAKINNASQAQSILIAAGGTGGHIFPGLAVAEALSQSGVNVEWLGGQHGLETKLVPKKYPLHALPMLAFRGGGIRRKLHTGLKLIGAFFQARRIIKQRNAGAVLIMGGYVSAPAGLAAKSLGIPLLIHEQNAVCGLANRYLSVFAQTIFEAFPHTFPAKRHALHTGNPLREGFTRPRKDKGEENSPLRVLVIGGSQGAQAINDVVSKTWPELSKQSIELWHQTGERDYIRCQASYSVCQHVRCEAFIDDMAQAFGWADCVISRAGALSVCEIAAAGIASVLVPYPHAVDDHQYRNAKHLESCSGAIIIRQADFTEAAFTAQIKNFLEDQNELRAMGQRAMTLAMPGATSTIAEACLTVLYNRGSAHE